MNKFYLNLEDIHQFTYRGFTSFVLLGRLDVQGEPPCDMAIEESLAHKLVEDSDKYPGYKTYYGARIVVSSFGLDTKTNGMLASLSGRPFETLECDYSNVADPIGPAEKYVRYHSIKKHYRKVS
jgi:hypothetical protein